MLLFGIFIIYGVIKEPPRMAGDLPIGHSDPYQLKIMVLIMFWLQVNTFVYNYNCSE